MVDRVLVVDDSLTVRMDLTETLEEEGFVVKAASTLDDARALIAAELPDVVLLDLELGEGDDGLGLLKELRASVRTQHLPVILLSSREAVEDRVRGVELGATDYLGKPYKHGPLLNAVAKAVGGASHTVSIPETATGERRPLVLIVDDSTTYREELTVQPVVDPLFARGGLALSYLVGVVDRNVVHPPAMDVKSLA